VKGPEKWAFPDDPALTVLNLTLPNEDVAAIDAAVERLGPLQDREDFIFMAVRYVLASLNEESGGGGL
jgi:Arc/MetJ-type ribon-helix-helix transcriptional regulator